MSALPVPPPVVAFDQLLKAINATIEELERLARERVGSMAVLAQDWIGGHRSRYETELRALERESVRLLDLLLQIAALHRRILENAPAVADRRVASSVTALSPARVGSAR